MSDERRAIGKRIKLIRKSLEMNQDAFGERVGVTKSTISAYENGDVFPPREVLSRIVRIGNKTFDWLFTGNECTVAEPATGYGVTHIHRTLTPEQEKLIQVAADHDELVEFVLRLEDTDELALLLKDLREKTPDEVLEYIRGGRKALREGK